MCSMVLKEVADTAVERSEWKPGRRRKKKVTQARLRMRARKNQPGIMDIIKRKDTLNICSVEEPGEDRFERIGLRLLAGLGFPLTKLTVKAWKPWERSYLNDAQT